MSSKSSRSTSKNYRKFTFKCERHSSIIFEKLQYFYEQNELYDTVLNSGQGKNFVIINAHRIVLCAYSEYFLEKFRDTQARNAIQLKEIEASILKLIIDFMYSGTIELSINTVEGILRAACFLKIEALIDGCCEFIEKNTTLNDASSWLPLAKELKLTRLGINVFKFKNTKNQLKKTSEPTELSMLNVNELKNLLLINNSHEDSKTHVFLSVVEWINYDRCNREHLLLQLLSMVNFKNLSPKFIVDHIETVCKTVESYELLCSWLKWHLSSEMPLVDQVDATANPRNSSGKLAVLQISDTAEIQIQTYDPKVDSWSIMEKYKANVLENKKCFSTIVIGRKLFVVGGKGSNNCPTNSVECLDLDTFESIDKLPPMGKSRCSCQLADLKGYLCAFDGFDEDFEASVEIFCFSTSQWREVQLPKMQTKKSQIASHNGILYILDLYNGFLQSYDASKDQWSLKEIERDLFIEFDLVAFEGFLYVIGGSWEKTIKIFDLSTDSWKPLSGGEATLKDIESCVKSTVFENKIVISGESCDKHVAVEEYNLATNTLNTLSSFSKDGTFKTFVMFVLPPLSK